MDNKYQVVQEEASAKNKGEETELSMAELLESQVFEREPQVGEIREGTIVSIRDDEILVSIGAKSEGIIKDRELTSIPPDERSTLAGRAVARHDNAWLERLQSVEAGEPLPQARMRACKGRLGAHGEIAGKQDAVRLDPDNRIAGRMV